jgi:hypothetical protein
VYFLPDDSQFPAVFFGFRQHLVAVLLELIDLAFDFRFVNAVGDVMDAVVDVERITEADEQVLLVELGIPLDSLVLDSLGDLPQLGDGLFLEFLVRIRHTAFLLSFCLSSRSGKKQNSFSNREYQGFLRRYGIVAISFKGRCLKNMPFEWCDFSLVNALF